MKNIPRRWSSISSWSACCLATVLLQLRPPALLARWLAGWLLYRLSVSCTRLNKLLPCEGGGGISKTIAMQNVVRSGALQWYDCLPACLCNRRRQWWAKVNQTHFADAAAAAATVVALSVAIGTSGWKGKKRDNRALAEEEEENHFTLATADSEKCRTNDREREISCWLIDTPFSC